MSIDESAIADLRSSLEADDYRLTVTETGTGTGTGTGTEAGPGIEVRITAGPEACDDCLVPKPIMRSVLHSALGVPEDAIALVYPTDDPDRADAS
jgi:hypothetical protein